MASRQREWQKKRTEQGLCSICSVPAIVRGYCDYHYEKRKERLKKRRQEKKGKHL